MPDLYNVVDELREMLFGENLDSFAQGARTVSFDASLDSGMIHLPPRYLMLKVTNRCNSNCCYCGHAESKARQEIKSDIRFDVLERTIIQAAELGVSAATISGGEPLLRNDIPQLLRAMLSHSILPVLLTNGLLLPQKWRSLSEAGLRYLIISVDSLDPTVYRLHRGAELSKALRGLDAAIAMRDCDSTVKIHITAVLTKHNIAEMPAFVRSMSERGISVQFSPYHHYNQRLEDVLSPHEESVVRGVMEELLRMKEEGYRIAGTAAFLSHIPDFFLNRQRIPEGYHCLSGYLATYVDAYGNVLPCWSSSFQPLCNLAHQSLKEIWFSESYAQTRKKMFQCACEGCWYLCTGELTTLYNEESGAYERKL